MKHTFAYGVTTLSLLLLLAGCTTKEGNENAKTAAEADARPLIYVSNYPLQYFAEQIAAPLAELRFPAKAATDPAYWNPAPEEVAEMQQADLIILNGASYEQWLKNVSLPQSRLVITADSFKDRLIPLEETVTHSHGPEGAHQHFGAAFTTWLDLSLAAEQARAIKDALSARWPEHQAHFENQFQKLEKELLTLDTELKSAAAELNDAALIFSHPVYQYFQRRYGLNGRSVHWEPDQMPDEKMWAELRQLLKTHPAKWMIWEGAPLSQIVAQLESAGINSIVIDPCGSVPEDGNFVTVMRNNLEALMDLE